MKRCLSSTIPQQGLPGNLVGQAGADAPKGSSWGGAGEDMGGALESVPYSLDR